MSVLLVYPASAALARETVTGDVRSGGLVAETGPILEATILERRLRDRPMRYRPNWRFEFSNDVLFDSDNFFSAGWSLQEHGPRVDLWDNARGTPAFGRSLARLFLPDQATDLSFRESWAIGQVISTPEDIETEELLENDIPYSALLAVTNGWTAFNDTRFTGFQWLLGVVGPAARGEEVQTAVHEVIGSPKPAGWDNQLDNEPILNVTYMRKRKLINLRSVDLAVNAGGNLGNWFTLADASMEFRIGKNKPGGLSLWSIGFRRTVLGICCGRSGLIGTWTNSSICSEKPPSCFAPTAEHAPCPCSCAVISRTGSVSWWRRAGIAAGAMMRPCSRRMRVDTGHFARPHRRRGARPAAPRVVLSHPYVTGAPDAASFSSDATHVATFARPRIERIGGGPDREPKHARRDGWSCC